MATFTPVTHVVFDVDGLLIDTENLYSQIMGQILAPHGHTFTWDVKRKQMGKSMRQAAEVLIEEYKLPISVDDYCQQVLTLTEKLFPDAKLMPGAERLIRHLAAHGIPMALASGASLKEHTWKTTNHQELFSVFKHAVLTSSDPEVKHGKPAPDCFLIAAGRFLDKPLPEKVLVFEDAPNGVEGALAANMQVVWIPDPNNAAAKLSGTATLQLTSLQDFQPEAFGLPAY